MWDPESICNLDVKRCFMNSDSKITASPLQNSQVELSASKLCPCQTRIDSLLVQESSLAVVGGTCCHTTFSLSSSLHRSLIKTFRDVASLKKQRRKQSSE